MAKTKTSKKTTKAPTVKDMTDAIIESMDRLTDDDVESALRAHIAKMGAERIKEMYHETVEMPEQRIDAILAGLKLLARASDEERVGLGIEWGLRDIDNLRKDIQDGELELVEAEGE